MNLVPLDDYIIVKPTKAPDKTPGGLYLPDQSKEAPLSGVIMAVGPGRLVENKTGVFTRFPIPDRNAGDIVLFGRYSGMDWKADDGETYKILRPEDVPVRIISEKK